MLYVHYSALISLLRFCFFVSIVCVYSQHLISSPKFVDLVTFVKGTPLADGDLGRAAAVDAEACFVLIDTEDLDADNVVSSLG